LYQGELDDTLYREKEKIKLNIKEHIENSLYNEVIKECSEQICSSDCWFIVCEGINIITTI
jgi:hypothetical protein